MSSNRRARHKPLTKDQQKLVEEHLWVAGRQAYRHYTINGGNTGLFTKEDLESVGRYALCVAASRWESDRGTKFSTYAWTTVSGYIQHSLRDHSRMVKVPRWVLYIRHNVKSLLDGGMSMEEVKLALSLNDAQILMVEDSWKESYKSLDFTGKQDDSGRIFDIPYYDSEVGGLEIDSESIESLAELSDAELRGFERFLEGGKVSKGRRKRFEGIVAELIGRMNEGKTI